MTDDIDSVITLLTNGWTAGNTDSITPDFKIIYEAPRGNLAGSEDKIYVHEASYNPRVNAFGTTTKASERVIRIDIYNAWPVGAVNVKNHFDKLKTEVERIMDVNHSEPFAGADVLTTISGNNLSNRNRGIYRYVYDVKIDRFNATRP